MKRSISLLAALCLVLPLAFGRASASVVWLIEPGKGDVMDWGERTSSYILQDDSGISLMCVDSAYFEIPGDGDYKPIFENIQLQAGQTVTVSAEWNPSFNAVWVLLEGPGLSRSMTLTLDRKTITFDVPSNGYYTLKLSTFTYETRGTINVTW